MATGRIGTTPVLQVRWSKAPSAGTTSLSGLDDNSVSLVYSVGYEAVYRNGVLLSRGNDYTATNGTTITLIDATIAGDIIEIFATQTVPLTDTFSQTVSDGRFIKNTLTTTTGDIIYASAANTPARLAIGSTDQVLKVSGGIPAWATPASGSMTSIASGSLSGTSVTLSSISGSYQNLRLIVRKCYFTSNAAVKFKVNTVESNAQWWRYFGGLAGAGSTTGTANTGATTIEGNQNALRNNASNVHTLILNIDDYTATTYKLYDLKAWYETSDSGNPEQVQMLTGAIKTSSAVTSIEIFSSVSFAGGTYELFGVK